ncbi:MAG: hypothetical protein SXG53_25705 [Pseudomonadota bacterium]|nr:hypothetical protein [Pseudomonadota bacterium]
MPPAPPSAADAALGCRLANAAQAVIDEVDLDPVSHLLKSLPTTPLLGELEAVVQALDGADAARSRKRAGILGRLVGRDLLAQADPDPAERRVRVHLVRADGHATALREHLRLMEDAWKSLQAQCVRLDYAIGRAQRELVEQEGRLPHDARSTDTARRRIDHQCAIATFWGQTCTQLGVAVAHGRLLLDRHVQVRDLLVPLWLQNSASVALRDSIRHTDLTRLGSLRRDARDALALFRTAPATPSIQPPPAPDDTEPSP